MLVGQPTLALVRDAIEVEPVGAARVEGQSRARPSLPTPTRARRAAEQRRKALFVGRERELALVREALERVQAPQCCELVTVVGDAGVGKSRLVAEALVSVEATVARSRCLPYGEGITYWPVVRC